MQGTIFLHLSPQFLSPPLFAPTPLAQCPINHHPHCTSTFTTPHHTAQHHTHTAQRCTTSAYPFGFGQCCRYAPHLSRTTEHLPHDKQHLQATSPQLTTTLHTVAQRSQKWLNPSHINNSHITQRCTK